MAEELPAQRPLAGTGQGPAVALVVWWARGVTNICAFNQRTIQQGLLSMCCVPVFPGLVGGGTGEQMGNREHTMRHADRGWEEVRRYPEDGE